MKTVCPQCHMDGHHKMSCTDESNQARKDRVNVPATLNEPIVEGAYYEREDGQVIGPSRWLSIRCLELWVGDNYYRQSNGELMGVSDSGERNRLGLTRRVWITPTDPAEVVAELRRHVSENDYHKDGCATLIDLVAEKLGLTPAR